MNWINNWEWFFFYNFIFYATVDPTKAMEEVRKMKFGLDMVEAGIAHVEFLADVDKHPCLYAGEYVQNAICRYETLWLPSSGKARAMRD